MSIAEIAEKLLEFFLVAGRALDSIEVEFPVCIRIWISVQAD